MCTRREELQSFIIAMEDAMAKGAAELGSSKAMMQLGYVAPGAHR
jgi:hypothetical protein